MERKKIVYILAGTAAGFLLLIIVIVFSVMNNQKNKQDISADNETEFENVQQHSTDFSNSKKEEGAISPADETADNQEKETAIADMETDVLETVQTGIQIDSVFSYAGSIEEEIQQEDADSSRTVVFANTAGMDKILPLAAHSHIVYDSSVYLKENDFSSVSQLTIINDSFVTAGDTITFSCNMNAGYEDILNIEYTISSDTFIFSIPGMEAESEEADGQ